MLIRNNASKPYPETWPNSN